MPPSAPRLSALAARIAAMDFEDDANRDEAVSINVSVEADEAPAVGAAPSGVDAVPVVVDAVAPVGAPADEVSQLAALDLMDIEEVEEPPVPKVPAPPMFARPVVPPVMPPRPPPTAVRLPPLRTPPGIPPAIPRPSVPSIAVAPPFAAAARPVPIPPPAAPRATDGPRPLARMPGLDTGEAPRPTAEAPAAQPAARPTSSLLDRITEASAYEPGFLPGEDDDQAPPSVDDQAPPFMDEPVDALAEAAVVAATQPLETHLDVPTVIDLALGSLADVGAEARAEALARELESSPDAAAAALIAYELGEHYERRLADDARAVKAFGRALTLDPSLRPNLWAIRRVFYRREMWPNLVKLAGAEVEYARDDHERADLLLEKARIAGHRLGEVDEARAAVDEAVRLDPRHQGALLELERLAARTGDVTVLLDAWEQLAEAVTHPARKISYWLEVGRLAGASDLARSTAAFGQAAALAASPVEAERVARDRLRVAEDNGSPGDVAGAIEALAASLLAGFGPAGPGAEAAPDHATDRATALRRELVALRRRQAQLARTDTPERAWDVLQQALALAPGEPLVLADLTELAEQLGRYEDLAELIESSASVEGDAGRAMVLSIRRADALLRGGQRDRARTLLASLEASAPGFIVLTSATERDALGTVAPAELASAYLAAASAAHLGTWLGPGQPATPAPLAAAALYVQAAELLAYEVGGAGATEAAEAHDQARAALGKALEAAPAYPAALEALTELDETTGRIEEGLARLRDAAAATTGDARRAILERAIRLARGHGDLDSVLALQLELVALAPAELDLRWRVEATLTQLGRDAERAQLLADLAGLETEPSRRGAALLGAARLRERASEVDAAIDLYRHVLALWPDEPFARESLIDLLRAQERWAELVTERRAEARALADGPAARRALREATWVLEIRLGDVATAAAVYEEWLARWPDDRTALEGAARMRAQSGDAAGAVVALRAVADAEPGADAQWLLGRALERAGQLDEAAEVYRALAVRTEPSIAASAAALGLAEIAASRGDTGMRLEAASALAARTTDSRVAAALAEDSGWMYALVLEDFERATHSFDVAVTLAPTRRGAQLGAALVAARRADSIALAAAFDGLSATVQMPEAAAALGMRAAAMAAAAREPALAAARVVSARASAPDDMSVLVVLAENSAVPAAPAADAAEIVGSLLARAELLALRSALADDPAAQSSWELDRAEALELAGRLREAGAVVAWVLTQDPRDLRALDALRRMARCAEDHTSWAQATVQLARAIVDPETRVALLRAAVAVFDAMGQDEQAIATYRRILEVEPDASEFEPLLTLLRNRSDAPGVLQALTQRLTFLDADERSSPVAAVPLLLERATVRHRLGDNEAAMLDLDALLDRASAHVEALRFRADLAFHAGDVDTAVALWRRYLQVETRGPRRAEVELQLSQVLAETVNDVAGAIEHLENVVEANPHDLSLRDRLLGLCLRVGDWARAARELRVLARQRPTAAERAREELRLALMLRDKLRDRAGAQVALERARGLDALNLDVIRELAELVDPGARVELLASTASGFRASIALDAKVVALYERLAQIAGWQSDVDARWLALVGVEALGTPSVDQRQVLAAGRQRLGVPAKLALDAHDRAALRGAALGPLAELWRTIAPAVQVATGVDPGKLGFSRGDRIPIKKLGDKYEPLVVALACFGLENVELYVSSTRVGIARALAAETPILCIGADVAAAAMPQQLFQLGRAVATLAEGLSGLPELRNGELGSTLAAALRAAEVAVPAELAAQFDGEEATIAERAKLIRKELGRKPKGAVVEFVRARTGQLGDIETFRRHAVAIGHRAGLLWAGDLAVAHTQLDVGKSGKAVTDSPAALELTAWSVSEDHARLRDKLGVALKGTR